MKNLFLLITATVIIFNVYSQPQAINYQGVARNAQGLPLLNRNISLRLSLLDSSAIGQAIFVETQNATTSSSGLFNIGIGLGTVVSGTFSSIPWGQGDKWLKTEMDTTGGSNFQLIGTTEFLSVPYALNSEHTNQTNSENWQYYGKENWVNSSLTKDISNLPIHDFWMLLFNLRFESSLLNDLCVMHLTLNNNNLNMYTEWLDNGNPAMNRNNVILFLGYSPVYRCFGSIILDGKHSSGLKLIENNNFKGGGEGFSAILKNARLVNDNQNLNSIQIQPDNFINGQLELYYRDNK